MLTVVGGGLGSNGLGLLVGVGLVQVRDHAPVFRLSWLAVISRFRILSDGVSFFALLLLYPAILENTLELIWPILSAKSTMAASLLVIEELEVALGRVCDSEVGKLSPGMGSPFWYSLA